MATGIESFRRTMTEAMAGDNIGLLLRGVAKDQVERGMVVAEPGSIQPRRRFGASGYSPQFFFLTAGVTGVVTVVRGVPVLPGTHTEVTVELGRDVAIDVGLDFAVREGNRTIGAGTVTELLD